MGLPAVFRGSRHLTRRAGDGGATPGRDVRDYVVLAKRIGLAVRRWRVCSLGMDRLSLHTGTGGLRGMVRRRGLRRR